MTKGHTPRNYFQRYAKWIAKTIVFNNSNVVLSSVSTIAQQNYQAEASKFNEVSKLISAVLTQHGITGSQRKIYHGFGRKVARVFNTYGPGPALTKMIASLKAYYITVFNANPQVLDAITSIITGSPNGYLS